MKINLGHALLRLRRDHCVTQQTISEYLFVSRPTYSSWENNNGEIPFTKLLLLLKFYKISLSKFMSLSDALHKPASEDVNYLLEIKADISFIRSELEKLMTSK